MFCSSLLKRGNRRRLPLPDEGDTAPPAPQIAGRSDQSNIGEVQLLPKQRIFLSHSGAQKPFVEQLCVDLENAGHFPFFDQRPDSLPKGERFPDLIFKAARQCRVAVVVLSKEFLESKWPILELVTFVEAQRSRNPNLKIVPLFYKIGIDGIKAEEKKLMALWRKRASTDTKLDPMKCLDALRVLTSINGEVFGGGSEVEYRKAVVASICRHLRPEVQFDVSEMVGRDRLCNIVTMELDKLCREHNNTRSAVVGVYGMGGLGKTLLCKALCNAFHSEFAGRVLHVELKRSCKESEHRRKEETNQNTIEVQKLILEAVTDASPELLRNIRNVEQGKDVFEARLPARDVFLAIDNVPGHDTKWLATILEHLSPRSKAIVTSRSLDNIKSLLEYCHTTWDPPMRSISYIPIPTVEKEEAMKIFQQHALSPTRLLTPFTAEEVQVLETCIKQCFFLDRSQEVVLPGFGHISGQYHPLALQALGSYLKGINPQNPIEWNRNLSKIVKGRHGSTKFYYESLFDILGVGYDALPSQQDKLMFLDIAIFAPRRKLNSVYDLCNWLSAIHDMDEDETLFKMKKLRGSSLIENWEKDKKLEVSVHDLYVDFAKHQIQQKEESQGRCVYQTGPSLPLCLQKSPPGLCYPDFVRLRISGSKFEFPYKKLRSKVEFPYEKLREWANLVVLDMSSLNCKSLDIRPLKCLRSLKLKSYPLESLTWADNMEQLRYVKLSCLKLERVPDFSTCSNLLELSMRLSFYSQNPSKVDPLRTLLTGKASGMKILLFSGWNERFPEILDLGNLPNLETVEIFGRFNLDLHERHEGSLRVVRLGALTQLRRLVLSGLPIWGSLPGLEKLVALKHLLLSQCAQLGNLPGLGGLTNLQVLDVSSTALEELPGVEKLLQLHGLYLVECKRLKSLPNLQALASLEEVFIQGCSSLCGVPLVPDSCTVVSHMKREVIRQWENFFDSYVNWVEDSVEDSSRRNRLRTTFQDVLSKCPTAESYLNATPELEGLEELSQAFKVVFSMMHDRATTAGEIAQNFNPEQDFGICSKLVSVIDKYSWHPELRASRKCGRFLTKADNLRRLVPKNSRPSPQGDPIHDCLVDIVPPRQRRNQSSMSNAIWSPLPISSLESGQSSYTRGSHSSSQSSEYED